MYKDMPFICFPGADTRLTCTKVWQVDHTNSTIPSLWTPFLTPASPCACKLWVQHPFGFYQIYWFPCPLQPPSFPGDAFLTVACITNPIPSIFQENGELSCLVTILLPSLFAMTDIIYLFLLVKSKKWQRWKHVFKLPPRTRSSHQKLVWILLCWNYGCWSTLCQTLCLSLIGCQCETCSTQDYIWVRFYYKSQTKRLLWGTEMPWGGEGGLKKT